MENGVDPRQQKVSNGIRVCYVSTVSAITSCNLSSNRRHLDSAKRNDLKTFCFRTYNCVFVLITLGYHLSSYSIPYEAFLTPSDAETPRSPGTKVYNAEVGASTLGTWLIGDITQVKFL